MAALLVSLCAACLPASPERKPPIVLAPHAEPDVQGVTHTVKPGETLWRIAKAYRVPAEDIATANHLADGTKVVAGQRLFIPGAEAPAEVASSGAPQAPAQEARSGPAPLAWPVAGVLYARFGPRGESQHDGIDLAAPVGTAVSAAADGEVVYAGEQKGYGRVVLIQHPNGLITVYAHNQEVLVKQGARVSRGQPIGRVGEAVKTSGPHVHFEVRENGLPKDPLQYLPPPR